jgi:hypothetical protein
MAPPPQARPGPPCPLGEGVGGWPPPTAFTLNITSFSIKFFPFHFYDFVLFHKPGIFYKTSFQIFLSFWEHVKTWVRQWVIPLHIPYTPPPIFHTQKLLLLFFSHFFYFFDSLFFHKPDIFYRTSFQFFLSFWEHVKTWVIPMGYPSTCPLHPPPIFLPNLFLLISFFFFFSFL